MPFSLNALIPARELLTLCLANISLVLIHEDMSVQEVVSSITYQLHFLTNP